MSYDGVVLNLNELYLFILNPDTNLIMDGINISYHECYKDLRKDQLMVVKVIFKDGTKEIDKIDLDEFIHGDKYGKHDVFLYITDVQLFSLFSQNKNKLNLEYIIKKGELNDTAIECINNSKSIKNNINKNE